MLKIYGRDGKLGRGETATHTGNEGLRKPLALWLSKVFENNLHLEGTELLAGLDVLGGKKVGHEVGIGVDFAGEEATGDLFVIAREIQPGQVLFECVT